MNKMEELIVSTSDFKSSENLTDKDITADALIVW